jgi:hypothetical protein
VACAPLSNLLLTLPGKSNAAVTDVELLKHTPLFSQMDDTDLAGLLDKLELTRFTAGEMSQNRQSDKDLLAAKSDTHAD